MTRTSRILMLVAGLLLVGMFFLPLWQIMLEAPQYPEGIGMHIHLHTVKGAAENDLANINNLNHYIGMKRIEPDAIAELTYMPFIIGGMILFALAAAALGRRALVLVWVILFLLLGVVGMVDFYMWEYDYGHDLDPHASIKIPGMSYQPPLIGSEQILNFTAHSYPSWGGILACISVALGVFSWWLSRRKKKGTQSPLSVETAAP